MKYADESHNPRIITLHRSKYEKKGNRLHVNYRRSVLLYVRFLFWKDTKMVDGELICGKDEFIKDGVKKKRVRCMVFTRVMGYLRPVQNYNPWKKSEFYGRKIFTEEAIAKSQIEMIQQSNRDFIAQYNYENQ